MAISSCYSGPNPVQDEAERMAIWKWAKANGIDQGLPYEKVHDAINNHFFGGVGRPEWTHEILGGRKTPLRQLSTEAWRTQYNRRMAVGYAKDQIKAQALSPTARAFQRVWSAPRNAAVFMHGWVFPITHGGDLLLRPASWGTFFRGLFNTYSKSFSSAGTERLLDAMRRDPLYNMALRSGLDVGAKSHAGNLVNRPVKGNQSTRAWDILTTMRFDLWNQAMQKYIKPGQMNEAEILDYGKNMAEWANHATGSAKMPVPGAGALLFGPKLTASKLARLGADPLKTFNTFANWNAATPGEKAVAWQRLSGLGQYLGTGLGFLAANYGLNRALGTKDKDNVNFTDQTKSDWLAFKIGGIQLGIPGLHSEIRTLGKILAIPFMDAKALKAASYGEARNRQEYLQKVAGDYLFSKVTPTIGVGKELVTGEAFGGRPLPLLPWAPKGTVKKPAYSWHEWLASHGPIIASEPAKYVYDHLREGGASPPLAETVVKGLIITGLGATGLQARDISTPQEKASLQFRAKAEANRSRQIARQLRGR
jgi:hypothetical protein